MSDAKQSYLDTIKEESESRRNKVYNQTIQNIYNYGVVNASIANKSTMLDLIPPNYDTKSVKSDQTATAAHTPLLKHSYAYGGGKPLQAPSGNLPVLPKARELPDR
jgi:hypothetical protein